MKDNKALVFLNSARRAVEKARTVQDLKTLRDKAEAVRQYAKQAGESRVIQNHVAEIKLRAKRKAGGLLREMAKDGRRPLGRKKESHGVTLAELGLSRMESSRWQQEHAVPDRAFETLIAETNAAEKELTQAGLLKLARRIEREKRHQDRQSLALTLKGKFQVFYADPPWQYSNEGFVGSGVAAEHYPTMPTQDICDLPVGDHSTDDAVLFLWTTNPLLPDGLRVMSAWGYSYKTNIVWIKDRATYLGFYVKGQHELLLIGIRGQMLPVDGSQPSSVIQAKRTKIHSEKPVVVYDTIEAMYPGLKYVELFSRKKRKGWVSWGNEPRG